MTIPTALRREVASLFLAVAFATPLAAQDSGGNPML